MKVGREARVFKSSFFHIGSVCKVQHCLGHAYMVLSFSSFLMLLGFASHLNYFMMNGMDLIELISSAFSYTPTQSNTFAMFNDA